MWVITIVLGMNLAAKVLVKEKNDIPNVLADLGVSPDNIKKLMDELKDNEEVEKQPVQTGFPAFKFSNLTPSQN